MTDDRTLDDAVADLEAEAQAGWAILARGHRWTLWMRLTWAVPVSEYRAAAHLKGWAARLQTRLPGAVVMVGQHSDSGRRHAHAMVFLPRRGAPQNPSGGWLQSCSRTWHQRMWAHGNLWVDRFRPFRIRGAGGDPHRHGAAEYMTKEPGTIELFGTPVAYQPRRSR